MDLLRYFAIRTALPFGYAAAALVLLGAAIVGLVLIWRGPHRRPRHGPQALIGLGFVAWAGVVTWANVVYEDALDLNPPITARALVGTWRDRGSRLTIGADGAYRCVGSACGALGMAGRWAYGGDHDLAFTRAGGARIDQRVVRYAGQLRLTEPIDDPDLWSGVLTFRHAAPAGRAGS